MLVESANIMANLVRSGDEVLAGVDFNFKKITPSLAWELHGMKSISKPITARSPLTLKQRMYLMKRMLYRWKDLISNKPKSKPAEKVEPPPSMWIQREISTSQMDAPTTLGLRISIAEEFRQAVEGHLVKSGGDSPKATLTQLGVTSGDKPYVMKIENVLKPEMIEEVVNRVLGNERIPCSTLVELRIPFRKPATPKTN